MFSVLILALLKLNTPAVPVSGHYIEARTASVFAGPCHYNGEVITTGRDAVMAWSIEHGSWQGIDLSGVRIAAAVSSNQNLAELSVAHRCEIRIDSAATESQATAALNWLTARRGASLGTIQKVSRTPIAFAFSDTESTFTARDFADLHLQSMPDHECCKQPGLIWYQPLSPLEHRYVGYTVEAGYSAGTLGDKWQRGDENSAFYGAFSF